MNFLAHLFLSGPDPKIMTGNFLGDFVKGREALKQYDPSIVRGIELHRGIDVFTDHHPIVQLSKNRLRPVYRHYSGVLVDMFYDHFLAAGWKKFHTENLAVFAKRAYQNLQDNQDNMPEEAKRVLPWIVKGDWLTSYASTEGLHKALSGMARRTTYESKMELAVNDLRASYSGFQNEFDAFFPELSAWAAKWLHEHPAP